MSIYFNIFRSIIIVKLFCEVIQLEQIIKFDLALFYHYIHLRSLGINFIS
jgi:hypothetical protein